MSFFQRYSIFMFRLLNRCRRYVAPLFLQGRDMVLLTTGGWVDDLPNIPESSVECRYLAEEQHLVFPGGGRMGRFPWLAVTDADHDMTDFFTDLRISAGNELSDEEIISLYAHQCQRFPLEPISITLREGE